MSVTTQSIVITTLVLSVMGCKPNPASDAKSLDNFAAGKTVRTNVCGISPQSKLRTWKGMVYAEDDEDAALLPDAVAATNAIPKSLADFYFDKLHGQIVITKEASKICSGPLQSGKAAKGAKAFNSCFVHLEKSNRRSDWLIVMPPDRTAIRRGLVRQFGYFVAQKMLFIERSGDTFKISTDELHTVAQNKAALAIAFLTDLAKSKRYSLAGLVQYIGPQGAAFIGIQLKNPKLWINDIDGALGFFRDVPFQKGGEKKLPDEVRTARERRFLDYIFAEAFDSYFCNSWSPNQETNTRSVMGREFPKSMAAFMAAYNNSLAAIAQRNSVQFSFIRASNSAPLSGGFSLQDESETPELPATTNEIAEPVDPKTLFDAAEASIPSINYDLPNDLDLLNDLNSGEGETFSSPPEDSQTLPKETQISDAEGKLSDEGDFSYLNGGISGVSTLPFRMKLQEGDAKQRVNPNTVVGGLKDAAEVAWDVSKGHTPTNVIWKYTSGFVSQDAGAVVDFTQRVALKYSVSALSFPVEAVAAVMTEHGQMDDQMKAAATLANAISSDPQWQAELAAEAARRGLEAPSAKHIHQSTQAMLYHHMREKQKANEFYPIARRALGIKEPTPPNVTVKGLLDDMDPDNEGNYNSPRNLRRKSK